MFTYFFFFQEEDGIRDSSVTGVQTCALPISILVQARPIPLHRQPPLGRGARALPEGRLAMQRNGTSLDEYREVLAHRVTSIRSEERRVGKECRSRGSPDH